MQEIGAGAVLEGERDGEVRGCDGRVVRERLERELETGSGDGD